MDDEGKGNNYAIIVMVLRTYKYNILLKILEEKQTS